MSKKLTQKRLKELFYYDTDTGLFTRLVYGNSKAKIGRVYGKGKCKQKYHRISINGKVYRNHRLAFLYMEGRMPKLIDHKNHNRYDNRWENLRETTQGENLKNQGRRKDNRTGVTGVTWNSNANRWHARIQVDGKGVHLGTFTTFSDAVNARKNAEVLYGYYENHGGLSEY